MTLEQVESFLKNHAGTTFKNVTERTDTEEITILANRHGQVKTLKKPAASAGMQNTFSSSSKKTKNYIIQEGSPVPFLVKLGVMTKEGKVIAQKYDKFRQINRFLEYISDIIEDVQRICTGDAGFTKERPLYIADFGCGKSYLTFAVYYFLHDIKNIPVEITGLDLKEDVIAECQSLAQELKCTGLHFYVGDIAKFSHKTNPDVIITLHACDTATDYALQYAVSRKAAAILSVPCCQHEINLSLDAVKEQFNEENPFASLMRYGIIKERFSALVTDAIRADILEQSGYSVQILEFIDMTHTPKNLLIRAVRRATENKKAAVNAQKRTAAILSALNVSQKLNDLLVRPEQSL
ncbi:MAG: SAM-dependent methyltransferase [Treponema sp.]|nr:SAM-dependent methyltransferase [Treponema sp.]